VSGRADERRPALVAAIGLAALALSGGAYPSRTSRPPERISLAQTGEESRCALRTVNVNFRRGGFFRDS